MDSQPPVCKGAGEPPVDERPTPLDQAIEAVGGVAVVAVQLNVSRQAVYKWRAKGLPAERVLSIEKLTQGRISRHDLRPDIYPRDMASGAPA